MTLLQKSFHWQSALEFFELQGIDVTAEVVVDVLHQASRWEAMMKQLEKMQEEIVSVMSQA